MKAEVLAALKIAFQDQTVMCQKCRRSGSGICPEDQRRSASWPRTGGPAEIPLLIARHHGVSPKQQFLGEDVAC